MKSTKSTTKGTDTMIKKIESLDNKLIQAQMLAYLINNKKVSKILKSTYIKHFTKIMEELPNYYHSYQYEVDMKNYFNDEETSNNIVPNFVSSTNYIDYSVTLNYTIKNKHLVESILTAYQIPTDIEDNFKNMKKVLSGKIDSYEFETEWGDNVIVTTEELEGRDVTKKAFKESLTFSLPNSKAGVDIQTYPLVFTYVTTKNSSIQFNIFSEEDILSTQHYTLPKFRINKFLNSSN
jgi:hypothetical protein